MKRILKPRHESPEFEACALMLDYGLLFEALGEVFLFLDFYNHQQRAAVACLAFIFT